MAEVYRNRLFVIFLKIPCRKVSQSRFLMFTAYLYIIWNLKLEKCANEPPLSIYYSSIRLLL